MTLQTVLTHFSNLYTRETSCQFIFCLFPTVVAATLSTLPVNQCKIVQLLIRQPVLFLYTAVEGSGCFLKENYLPMFCVVSRALIDLYMQNKYMLRCYQERRHRVLVKNIILP